MSDDDRKIDRLYQCWSFHSTTAGRSFINSEIEADTVLALLVLCQRESLVIVFRHALSKVQPCRCNDNLENISKLMNNHYLECIIIDE